MSRKLMPAVIFAFQKIINISILASKNSQIHSSFLILFSTAISLFKRHSSLYNADQKKKNYLPALISIPTLSEHLL